MNDMFDRIQIFTKKEQRRYEMRKKTTRTTKEVMEFMPFRILLTLWIFFAMIFFLDMQFNFNLFIAFIGVAFLDKEYYFCKELK